ncbi:hypothetical protein [Streptomyces xiamenensis]|uniref:hypothetical protein n=1 Tax=Streptomyces xiamenensis TaxID=408015 RepID=UPI0037D38317
MSEQTRSRTEQIRAHAEAAITRRLGSWDPAALRSVTPDGPHHVVVETSSGGNALAVAQHLAGLGYGVEASGTTVRVSPPAPESPSRQEQIRALLSPEQRPATDELLLSLAESVRDRREHQHPTGPQEDLFCGNLAGWAGERMGAVLARLADTEDQVDKLKRKLRTALDGVDEKLRDLDAEVRRYAAGEEAPVLWSVYNKMHQRALQAEHEAGRLRAELKERQSRAEAGETEDFFRPGVTYQRRRWIFQCLSVGPKPNTDETRAIGWLGRPGETATPTALRADDWAHGEWLPQGGAA